MTSPSFAALALFAPSGGGSYGLPMLIIQFGLIFAIFYFLLIRPQQRQRKQQEERLMQIRKGDQIVTAGGIVGEVVHIRMTTKEGAATPALDDQITIKSGESRLIVERQRIARVATTDTSAAAPTA
jgi:preprotein translocase subunit YajC